MNKVPIPIPIIETATYQRLKLAVENIADQAGLGVVRGPVGIGKSFALEHILREFDPARFNVLLTTARTETEGSVRLFANSVMKIQEGRTGEAVDALQNTLLRERYYAGQKPTILIVDESQGLKINVMEMLRGIWDDGEPFRKGVANAPTCGMLFVGNERFLSKRGSVRAADYGPFMDRLLLQMTLERPSRTELVEYAQKVAGSDEGAVKALAEFGVSNGNFRSMQQAIRQAQYLSGDEPITATSINDAIYMVKGL